MKLSFDTGHEFRPAMEAVRTMGLGNEHGADTPACRLVVKAGAKSVQALALTQHYALRLNVPVGTGANEPGDTTLPAGAVRALCAAPLRAPLTIEAEGITIVATIGKRSHTFEAPWAGPKSLACERIVDGDARDTNVVLATGPSAERLYGADRDAETFRISVGADGVHAWSGNDEKGRATGRRGADRYARQGRAYDVRDQTQADRQRVAGATQRDGHHVRRATARSHDRGREQRQPDHPRPDDAVVNRGRAEEASTR